MIPKLIIGLSLTFSFWGCSKDLNTIDFPSFLNVKSFILETNTVLQGSSSSKISGGWLFVDDEFLGYYKLPNSIPILKKGQVKIMVSPGILENGISATPGIYPFYTSLEQTVELTAGKEIELEPVIRYSNNTKFALIENFESGFSVLSEVIAGASFNKIENQKEVVFEGQQSGRINLSEEYPSVEIASGFRWPKNLFTNPKVYIELNYKSEVPGVFGLIGYPNSNFEEGIKVYRYGFNPSQEWNKIYFNLTDLLSTSNFESYRLIFKAELNPDEKKSASVFLDNLKVIHF